ncbi:MAG: hypothetical protein LBR53_03275 [Deltaproteobacteria bacterium]|jgi:hypothetical protein|nr:hypothetical protein [Deltaproteobacteria bacterium]
MEYKLCSGQYFIYTLKLIEIFFKSIFTKIDISPKQKGNQDKSLSVKSQVENFLSIENYKRKHEDLLKIFDCYLSVENYLGKKITLPDLNTNLSLRRISAQCNVSHQAVLNYLDHYEKQASENCTLLNMLVKPLTNKTHLTIFNELPVFIPNIVAQLTENRMYLSLVLFHWHDIFRDKQNRDLSFENEADDKLPGHNKTHFISDLINLSDQLRAIRSNVNYDDTEDMLRRYFNMYGHLLRLAERENLFKYTYNDHLKFNYDPAVAGTIFYELSLLYNAFYSKHQPMRYDGKYPLRKSQIKTVTPHVDIYEYPKQIASGKLSDTSPLGDLDASFKYVFGSIFTGVDLMPGIISQIDRNWYPGNNDGRILYEEAKNVLSQASPNVSGRAGEIETIIDRSKREREYRKVDDLDGEISYMPLIDATEDFQYSISDFEFTRDEKHKPSLDSDLSIFEPLFKILESEALEINNRARRGKMSERKMYIFDSQFDDKNNFYKFKARKIPYFEAVARRHFFISLRNDSIEKVLLDALKYDTLRLLLDNSDIFSKFINFYSNTVKTTVNKIDVIKEHYKDTGVLEEIYKHLKEKLGNLYEKYITNSVILRSNETGASEFKLNDAGMALTGCGTLILGKCRDGGEKRYILLEKRWKVLEESGKLGYPSAASCDFYDTAQSKMSYDTYGDYRADESGKLDFEANPFITAKRELHEELNMNINVNDLRMISFGIDTSRNVQQFSFYLETEEFVEDVWNRKLYYAPYQDEGKLFILPFKKSLLIDILNNFKMESGTAWSLLKLMEIKKELLWKE